MAPSTHFTQPKLQLSSCASDINSTTNCASSHQKASAQSQTARNAAMSGGARQVGGDGNAIPGRITVSQGPASAGGAVPSSPTTANTNMVGTTQSSIDAQAQTQYDNDGDTTGKIPASSSPRALVGGGDKSQQSGGAKQDEDKFGSWFTRLNRSSGGAKKTRKGRRRAKQAAKKTRKGRGGAKQAAKKKKNKKRQKTVSHRRRGTHKRQHKKKTVSHRRTRKKLRPRRPSSPPPPSFHITKCSNSNEALNINLQGKTPAVAVENAQRGINASLVTQRRIRRATKAGDIQPGFQARLDALG